MAIIPNKNKEQYKKKMPLADQIDYWEQTRIENKYAMTTLLESRIGDDIACQAELFKKILGFDFLRKNRENGTKSGVKRYEIGS